MAKNLNKVRTIHPTGRAVEFKTVQQAAKFVNLYKDLFYKPKERYYQEDRSDYGFTVDRGYDFVTVHFTIQKKDWDVIEKTLNLKRGKPESHYLKNRYFVYED